MNYKKEHYNLLLAQLLRSMPLLHLAASELDGLFFNQVGGSRAQSILFEVIKKHYVNYQVAPDKAVLITEVRAFVDSFKPSEGVRQEIFNDLREFLAMSDLVTSASEGVTREIVQYMAQKCVYTPAVTNAITAYQTADGEEKPLVVLREQLQGIESKQSVLSAGVSETGILSTHRESTGDIMPTYIPWIDARFSKGQGLPKGSVIGIIAPQGHGKTTLGIQLAVSQALRGKHAMLVLAEEGLTLPVLSKITACALGICYEVIRDAEPEQFPDKIRAAVKASGLSMQDAARKIANIDTYLHVIDLVASNGVVNAMDVVEGEYHMLRTKNQEPVYTYIDWAGIIAAARCSAAGTDRKEPELRILAYWASRVAQNTGAIIAISQQMAPAEAKRGPFAEYDQMCAADCKGFTEPFKTVMVIAPRDPRTKFSILHTPKLRDGELPSKSILKLRGEISTFEDVTAMWEIAGKRLVSKSSSTNSNAIPS